MIPRPRSPAKCALSADVAARLRAGETCLVITTIQHPNGVIRGQMVPQPARLPEPTLADD